jgi:hypothetical protein
LGSVKPASIHSIQVKPFRCSIFSHFSHCNLGVISSYNWSMGKKKIKKERNHNDVTESHLTSIGHN